MMTTHYHTHKAITTSACEKGDLPSRRLWQAAPFVSSLLLACQVGTKFDTNKHTRNRLIYESV